MSSEARCLGWQCPGSLARVGFRMHNKDFSSISYYNFSKRGFNLFKLSYLHRQSTKYVSTSLE